MNELEWYLSCDINIIFSFCRCHMLFISVGGRKTIQSPQKVFYFILIVACLFCCVITFPNCAKSSRTHIVANGEIPIYIHCTVWYCTLSLLHSTLPYPGTSVAEGARIKLGYARNSECIVKRIHAHAYIHTCTLCMYMRT